MPLKFSTRFICALLVGLGLLWHQPAFAEQSCGVLWLVQSDGAENHLFGTVHSEDPRVLELPTPVSEAFEESDTYVMELVPDVSAMAELIRAMHYQDQGNLKKTVGEDLFRRAVNALATRGVGEGIAMKMKPWAVAVTLSFPQPESGMFLDLMLYNRALQNDKTTLGLESVSEQLSFFQNLDDAEQLALLRSTLDNLPEMETAMEQMIRGYLERDPDRLLALNRQYMDELPEGLAKKFQRQVIVQRNHLMARRLEPHLREGGVFAAVGALHLHADNGLVSLLRERGFEVSCVY